MGPKSEFECTFKAFISAFVVFACTRGEPVPVPPTPLPAENPIAKISQVFEDVKLRRSKELIWNGAVADQPLYNFDAIKTGAGSTGRVQFTDSTELHIKELSLVVIVDRKTVNEKLESVVAMNEGEIDGRVNDSELLVKTPSAWLRVVSTKQSESRFRTTIRAKENMIIEAGAGQVRVQAREKEITIERGQSLHIPWSAAREPMSEKSLADMIEPPSTDIKQWKVNKAMEEGFFQVLEPSEKITTSDATIKIKGLASKNFRVFLKNKQIKVNKDDTYSVTVKLTPGHNLFTLQVVNVKTQEVIYHSLEVVKK